MTSTKKICILGESDVGKTTFIKLIITGIYTEKNEKKIRGLVLDTSRFKLKYYRHPIEILDGSNSYEKDDLIKLLEISNVAVIFYDFQNPNSFQKIKQEILPLTANFENIYSVIIVGNKFDLLDSINQKFAADKDREDIQSFQVEEKVNIKYFAISCQNYLNISDLVYEMLDSLVNPTKILVYYENSEENYNKNYIKALTRIFRIYDKTNVGVLNNNEFMELHQEIFDLKLESEHLNGIKELLKILKNKNVNINSDKGIDLEGFISLNKVSVYINESQITWSILRKFGYNDELDLDNTYLIEKRYIFDSKHQNIYQLSDLSIKKIADIFNYFSVKIDDINVMTKTEWEKLFYPCYKYYSFEEVLKNFNINKNFIDLNDFTFFWNSICKISVIEAYKLFLGVGFDISYLDFCNVTSKSTVNYFHQLSFRSYHVCFVIGKDEYRAFLNIIFDKNEEKIQSYETSLFKYIPLHYNNFNIIISFEFIYDIALTKSKEDTNNWHKYDLFVFSDTIFKVNIYKYFQDFPFLMIFINKPISTNDKLKENELYFDNLKDLDSIYQKIYQFIQEPIFFLNEKNIKEATLKKKKKYMKFSLGLVMFSLLSGAIFVGYKYFNIIRSNLIK